MPATTGRPKRNERLFMSRLLEARPSRCGRSRSRRRAILSLAWHSGTRRGAPGNGRTDDRRSPRRRRAGRLERNAVCRATDALRVVAALEALDGVLDLGLIAGNGVKRSQVLPGRNGKRLRNIRIGSHNDESLAGIELVIDDLTQLGELVGWQLVRVVVHHYACVLLEVQQPFFWQ